MTKHVGVTNQVGRTSDLTLTVTSDKSYQSEKTCGNKAYVSLTMDRATT